MKQKHIYNLAALLLASSAAFISCSDTDLDGPQPDGDRGASVVFNIKDIQQDNIAKVAAATRAGMAPTLLYTPGLTQEDLAPRRLEAVSSDGLDACLIETTVEGINPTKPDPSTRAKVETSIEHDFTSLGYRGETAGTISDKPEWFYSKKTKKNGELYETHFWSWGKPYGRFYAIYPEATAANKITLSPDSHQGTPYIDFEVEEDVADQKDLMTACSGVVHYDTQNTAPTTNLEFRHALTAIKFAVGNNLSWGKQITNIEIRNAVYKGRYILSDKLNGDAAHWDAASLQERKDFSLTVSPTIDTKKNPGAIITGAATDNYTFYMIPQTLTGNNVKALIYFTDGSTIEVTLTGTWKAGTTKTYKLSHTNSTWNYVLTTTSPIPIAYNVATTDNYGITSYRRAPDGTIQPMKWEVVGYDADGDDVFKMEEKPSWLTSLSKTSGNGGTAAETGTATLETTQLIDSVAPRNKGLKEATARGTSTNYYDLSTHDVKGNVTQMNTANCYVISAPGYYKLPLVYGNAIKNGVKNESSYKPTVSSPAILPNFVDHLDHPITDPWIGVTNGGANVPTKAKLIWSDAPGIVAGYTVKGTGNNAYLQFRVLKSAITNANAEIAITDDAGKVFWSWHLWFAPANVLDKIEVTNASNIKYNFTKETLGWKYTRYERTPYDDPRSVKVKVRQLQANNGQRKEAVITLTQNNFNTREGLSTLYQFGRFAAMPGKLPVAEGAFSIAPGKGSIGAVIQCPQLMLTVNVTPSNPFTANHYNFWSANNASNALNDDPVVKTVYDPSPVGFHMPPPNAFNSLTGSMLRGLWEHGWNFYTNSSKTAVIYMPATGAYYGVTAYLYGIGNSGYYWTNTVENADVARDVLIEHNMSHLTYHIPNRTCGYGVRPVADE